MATVFTKFLNLFIDDRSNFAMLIRDFLDNYQKIDEFAEKTDSRLYNLETSKCPYNIGDLYLTTNNIDPSTIWRATQWEKVSNRDTFLMINPDSTTAGISGGRNNFKLNNNNIPAHSHTVTVGQDGGHNHTININNSIGHNHEATIQQAGNHSHDNTEHGHYIKPHKHTIPYGEKHEFPYGVDGGAGKLGSNKTDYDNYWPFTSPLSLNTDLNKISILNSGNHGHNISISTSGVHNHGATSESSGNHGHNISIGTTGSGTAVDFLPSYFNVNVYKRIA